MSEERLAALRTKESRIKRNAHSLHKALEEREAELRKVLKQIAEIENPTKSEESE